MPVKPSRSISCASSTVAFRRPGTAARLTAGFLVIASSVEIGISWAPPEDTR